MSAGPVGNVLVASWKQSRLSVPLHFVTLYIPALLSVLAI
jgi:hypothetical protein